jgi:hypothetical protein
MLFFIEDPLSKCKHSPVRRSGVYGDPLNLETLTLLTHIYIIGLLEDFFKVIIFDESVKARIHSVLGFGKLILVVLTDSYDMTPKAQPPGNKLVF